MDDQLNVLPISSHMTSIVPLDPAGGRKVCTSLFTGLYVEHFVFNAKI